MYNTIAQKGGHITYIETCLKAQMFLFIHLVTLTEHAASPKSTLIISFRGFPVFRYTLDVAMT